MFSGSPRRASRHDRDGTQKQVVTACQAACPTQVFTFGNINEPDSDVAERKHSPLDYALLADQNTHPRLTYEARIRNHNPGLDVVSDVPADRFPGRRSGRDHRRR